MVLSIKNEFRDREVKPVIFYEFFGKGVRGKPVFSQKTGFPRKYLVA